MKTNAPAALYASVLLACAQITLAAYSCNLTSENDYYRNPQWKCDVCGDYLRGSSGIGCIPQNATFDDIPVGPIGIYQNTTWTNFVNVANTLQLPLLPTVKAVSKPNFAKLAAGKTGILAYDFNLTGKALGGFLKTMRYACALPLTSIPIACTVTIATTCSDELGPDRITTKTTVTSYRYDAGLNATMVSLEPGLSSLFTCFNSSISAKSHLGGPVELYIDEVLHGRYQFYR